MSKPAIRLKLRCGNERKTVIIPDPIHVPTKGETVYESEREWTVVSVSREEILFSFRVEGGKLIPEAQ